MQDTLISQSQKHIDAFQQALASRFESWTMIRDAQGLFTLEQEVASLGRALADGITTVFLKNAVENREFQQEMTALARASGEYRGAEIRPTNITLLGGTKITVRTPYLKRRRNKARGRRRGTGRRGRGGTGLFPVMAALGIWFGVTLALSAEVSRQVVDSDSVRSGREALAHRGIDLGHKQTQRIVNNTSRRLVQLRQDWLESQRKAEPPTDGILAGKRVVVAMDGGRLRERLPAKRGRRNAKTGHRRYKTPWREPKLFVIYTIDKQGEVEESYRPVYDGTLKDCDAMFEMLTGYLKALGANNARELVVVGDGAKWIWTRIPQLANDIGLPLERIREVVDWYHAVQVLHEIAAVPVRWSQAQRDKWVKHMRNLLYRGQIEAVDVELSNLAQGRNARKISKHRDYFIGNHDRMQYSTFKRQKVPQGSGAVESAIRRVVNMRMKGNGTFWLEANAEGMLMMRCYIKSRRLDDLMTWYGRAAVAWRYADGTSPYSISSAAEFLS